MAERPVLGERALEALGGTFQGGPPILLRPSAARLVVGDFGAGVLPVLGEGAVARQVADEAADEEADGAVEEDRHREEEPPQRLHARVARDVDDGAGGGGG
eukprot:513305-Rhodomonas_salina.1